MLFKRNTVSVDDNSVIQYNIVLHTQKDASMTQQTFTTKAGGTVTFTKTGLIHRAGTGAYSGRLAELNTNAVSIDTPKRGRGRPRKNA